LAVCPAVTVAEVVDTEAGASAKSWPVPERATVWGLPGASSVIVKVPDTLPAAEGPKKTPIVQLTPGGTLLVHPLVAAKLALACTLVIVNCASPVLVRVTF
jgi:hypothetical protein